MKRRLQGGIVLLEALIAVLILAIGLLGTIGLQARSYAALNDSSQRAEATLSAEKLLGIMSSDAVNLASYALAAGATPGDRLKPWYDETIRNIPGARIAVTVTPDATARAAAVSNHTLVVVSISWTRKAGGEPNVHRVTSYIAQS